MHSKETLFKKMNFYYIMVLKYKNCFFFLLETDVAVKALKEDENKKIHISFYLKKKNLFLIKPRPKNAPLQSAWFSVLNKCIWKVRKKFTK